MKTTKLLKAVFLAVFTVQLAVGRRIPGQSGLFIVKVVLLFSVFKIACLVGDDILFVCEFISVVDLLLL